MIIPTQWEVTVAFPFRLRSLPNERLHRFAFARVVSNTRTITALELINKARPFWRGWQVMKGNFRLRLRVLMVRVGPKVLDGDNCTAAFKPVRCVIARFFSIDDGHERFLWLPVVQEVGDHGVRLHLSVVIDDEYVHVELKPGALDGMRKRSHKKKFKPTPNVRKPR